VKMIFYEILVHKCYSKANTKQTAAAMDIGVGIFIIVFFIDIQTWSSKH